MKKGTQNIAFALSRISTEQFAIIDEEFESQEDIQLETNIKYGVDEQDRIVSCFVKITFASDNGPFLMVEGGCHFVIKDECWVEMASENEIVLPKGFVTHIAVLTVGTVRGILHTKTEGTNFNKYILPTINLSEIIMDDAVLAFN